MTSSSAPPAARLGAVFRVVPALVATIVVGGVFAAFVVQQVHTGSLLPASWCRWHPAGEQALPPITLGRLLGSWQLDVPALAFVGLLALGYAVAVRRVRRAHPRNPWPALRCTSFALGLLVIVAATCSGVGVYDMTQFWVHMIQHLLLIMVAPVFLAAGRPLMLLQHSVRNPWHTRVKRFLRSGPIALLTSPVVALAAYAVTIVGTHLSGLMGVVMQHSGAAQFEHLLYVVSGVLYFQLLFGDEPIRWKLAMPARLALVALSMAVDTFVGLTLLQSSNAIQTTAHPGWGLAPLSDTHMGGGIMWAGGDGLMAVILVSLLLSWMRRPEYARGNRRSWGERARRANFDEQFAAVELAPQPGGPAEVVPAGRGDIDDDDAAFDAYNRWLARLAAGSPPHPR